MASALTDPDPRRHEEAGRWFAAQRRGLMTLEERRALAAWRSDPDNAEALDRLAAAWSDLERLPAPAETAEAGPRIGRRGLMAAVAAIATLMVVGPAGYRLLSAGPDETVRTAVGEQRAVTLPDGSIAYLNVHSELRYRFADDTRELALVRGDALFDVAKDPRRPFIVIAGTYEVRAVGTEFSVSLRSDNTARVAVSEGIVAVRREGSSLTGRSAEARVAAGWAIEVGKVEGRSLRPQPIPAQRVGEWRRRVITYEDASLGEVVADLNRYFPGTIRVADEAVAAQRVTLRLPVGRRDDALATLADLFALRVAAEKDGEAVLTRIEASR